MKRKLFLGIIVLVLMFNLVGCGSDSGNSISESPIISKVNVPTRVATNASYMMSIETEEEADVNVIPDQGSIVKKDAYGNKIEWKTNSYEGNVTLKVIADNSGEITTKNKNIEVIETPVNTEDYYLWEDSIGATNIDITFTNNSSKNVIAFDIKIVGWNNFGERIPTDYLGEDYTFNGTASDVYFISGESKTYTWGNLDIYFINPITKAQAYVTRIAYEDGSSWELN